MTLINFIVEIQIQETSHLKVVSNVVSNLEILIYPRNDISICHFL